jgi:primosomal replication protein N
MGHKFTKEEKGALLNDKNLGKTVELTPKIGERGPFYLSIDSKTNELIPLRTSYIQIPDKIKGAGLSAEQKENLAAGKKVTVEGMTSKDDKKFSAALQIDAASRKIGFSDFKNEKLGKSEEVKQDKQEGKNQGARQKVG